MIHIQSCTANGVIFKQEKQMYLKKFLVKSWAKGIVNCLSAIRRGKSCL